MKKQQFAFQFSFAVILFTSLLGAPIRANAGGTNDFAPRPDGTPARPETFPARGDTPLRIASPLRGKVRLVTSANGETRIAVTPAIQRSINQKATTIFTNQRVIAGRQITTRNGETTISRVMVGRDNPTNAQTQLITNAQTQLTNSLSESGVSTNNITILTEKISSLLVVRTQNIDASETNISVEVEVDVNQLNEAINAYNKIVNSSKGSVIRKLAQNRDFREIRDNLVDLVSGFN